MRFRKSLIVLSALLLGVSLRAAGAEQAGETIYKSFESNGEVSYSWRPDPGALRAEAIEVNALTPEQRRAVERLRREEVRAGRAADSYARGLQDQWVRVDVELRQALAELQKAEAALSAGRTPLPGERRANAGGGSRLTQAYFDRLHDLELGVERSKQRLDNAYDARNELK